MDEADTVVMTTLGVLRMVVWGRMDLEEDPTIEEDRDDAVVNVVAPSAPVLEEPKPGTFPEAVGLMVEWEAPSVAVTGHTVVDTATTIVVRSPTVQSDAAVGQVAIVDVWDVKIVLVVIGTEALCSSEVVLMMAEPEPEAEGVTATAAVSDVAVAGTGTGLVSEARAELSEASEAVTGQIVVSTTTTKVVSPASFTPVEVPVT